MKTTELTRLAFIWAEQDRSSLADAWPKGSDEAKKAALQAKQLRDYRMRRWGRTMLESMCDKAKSKNLKDIRRL